MMISNYAAKIAANRQEIERHIREEHLKVLGDADGPVFFISGQYPGVWLEHAMDPLIWAERTGETYVAVNHIRLFLRHQKPDGQLPMQYTQNGPGYGQIQECVSFGRICLMTYQLTGDQAFLKECYDALCRWDEWLVRYRMTTGRGLIEMFCGYDTGHDNSGRLTGIKYPGKVSPEAPDAKKLPEGCPVLPGIAPDMNAVFYGDRAALGQMAEILGDHKEAAAWADKAETVRQRLMELCYDPADAFFYDVDKYGKQRKYRTIAITNVLHEGVVNPELTDHIFERYLWNEKEFRTPYPFPSMSIADPEWKKNRSGNSWGYYSQALTVLRATRWMPRMGRQKELRQVLDRWAEAWTVSENMRFGQELDPITGQPSDSSAWYSSGMLLYLLATD